MPTGQWSPPSSSKKTSLCSTCRPLQKTPTEQNAELWSTVPVDTSPSQLHPRTGVTVEEPEAWEVCCETVTPTKVRETESMKSHQHGCLNKT